MPRNPRPAWRGIGGRHAAELGAGIGRNTQTVPTSDWLVSYFVNAEELSRGDLLLSGIAQLRQVAKPRIESR
jgi:hypothetical protein